jgi:hypothetical protein
MAHCAAMALTAPQILGRGARGIGSSGLTRDDVMTACEVAELLRLPVSTVYKWPAVGRSRPAGWAHVAVPPSPDRRGAGLVNELGGRSSQPGQLGTTWAVSTLVVGDDERGGRDPGRLLLLVFVVVLGVLSHLKDADDRGDDHDENNDPIAPRSLLKDDVDDWRGARVGCGERLGRLSRSAGLADGCAKGEDLGQAEVGVADHPDHAADKIVGPGDNVGAAAARRARR